MNSHNDWACNRNTHPVDGHVFHTRRAVGTQDDGGLVGTISRIKGNAEKPKLKAKVMMSHSLKSFDDMSLKVVAVRTATNSDFEFEFPASGPQSTPSALTIPLEQLAKLRRGPLAQYPGWYHGGINE